MCFTGKCYGRGSSWAAATPAHTGAVSEPRPPRNSWRQISHSKGYVTAVSYQLPAAVQHELLRLRILCQGEMQLKFWH